ncbi:MAG: exodeoxyribonuclease V subunit alpha, partial [Solirubrobacterales bacterium]|nr:exodeoxyribonuclease V subunit alpha [Solirubrobacterales bacterium]
PVSERARTSVRELAAGTIHRLLGARGPGRFRHDANNPLPHDIVIVDETSMVSLSLVCRLLDAVRSDARLVLVGDPDQLSAIEAGAVLADIVGPAAEGPAFGPGMRAILTKAGGADPGPSTVESEFGSGVVVLRHGHRFGAPIGQLADAIRRGDTDAAVSAAASDVPEIDWIRTDPAALSRGDGGDLRASVLAGFGEMLAAAREGAGAEALAALGTLRLLCAHRHGPYGVSSWTASVEDWLTQELGVSVEGDYPGRPLLITENDHELRLYNGDAGVIVSGPDGPTAVFEREGGQLSLAPARLAAVETAFASTIHKSQGSQFSTAAVILPGQDSRLLTRELLYTAVTRARKRVLLVGEEAALRAAVERPVQRATGLQNRLWG